MLKKNVLDKGWVQLEEMMGGDEACVEAARICYQSEGGSEEANKKLINRLMKAHHNTPFEHAVFRFRVKAPLFVTRQWMRHRLCSYNEKSLRYCIADKDYYIPEDTPYGIDNYIQQMESSFNTYQALLRDGWKREQARGILGTAIYTEFIWTVNAWSLINWMQKRSNTAAQWEHRQYALAVLEIFEEAMPITAKAFKKHILR